MIRNDHTNSGKAGVTGSERGGGVSSRKLSQQMEVSDYSFS